MTRILRILNLLVGLVLALSVVTGVMDIALFVVPDLLLAGFLVAASIIPARWFPLAMTAASGFASGVFTVAVTRYVLDGQAVNPPLVIMLGIVATTAVILIGNPPAGMPSD